MAIRAAGTYVSKSKGARKNKSRAKENRFSKNKFFTLTSSLFPKVLGHTSHPKMRSKQDLTPFLLNRTFSVNQADLESDDINNTPSSYNNFLFKVSSVKKTSLYSSFNGLEVNREKVASMIRKNHTLIEINFIIKTKDESTWRFFINAVTKKIPNKSKSYAKLSQIKVIRKNIKELVENKLQNIETEKLVKLLMTDALTKEIEAEGSKVYPITALLRKVKAIKNMQCIVKKNKEEEINEENTFEGSSEE